MAILFEHIDMNEFVEGAGWRRQAPVKYLDPGEGKISTRCLPVLHEPQMQPLQSGAVKAAVTDAMRDGILHDLRNHQP